MTAPPRAPPAAPQPSPSPLPALSFSIGSATFWLSPSATGGPKQALAACQAWKPTAQLLWWDNTAELDAIAAKLPASANSRLLLATDLSCTAGGSAGVYSPSDAVCARSSGQRVPPQLLRWYKISGSSDTAAFAFDAVLYVQAGGNWGLIGVEYSVLQPLAMCRAGGEQRQAS